MLKAVGVPEIIAHLLDYECPTTTHPYVEDGVTKKEKTLSQIPKRLRMIAKSALDYAGMPELALGMLA